MALAKALGVNMVVGVVFCVLAVLYGISAFVNNQVQLRSMNRDSYRINSRLILASSVLTLICYALLLAHLDNGRSTEGNSGGTGGR